MKMATYATKTGIDFLPTVNIGCSMLSKVENDIYS